MEFKIYVVFHKYIIDNCYTKDTSFDMKYYDFIKCNELFEAQYNKSLGYNILYENNFNIYNPKLQDLNKPYMAISAIYHIYKNELYKNLNYIGFIEYDLSLEVDPKTINRNPHNNEIQKQKNIKKITEHIKNIVTENERIIIVLSARNRFRVFYEEANNMLINGQNLFNIILEHFNKFYNTNHCFKDIWDANPLIGDQQSFLADKKSFETIMGFLSYLIENKVAELPGFRPSFLLPRYLGMTFYLLDIPTKILSLKHLNKHEW